MSWSRSSLTRVKATLEERRETYGLTPPRDVERIVEGGADRLGPYGRLRLWWYVYGGGLFVRLRLFWHVLVDRDTPGRRRRVVELQGRLLGRLSKGCRVSAGYFERRLYARDLAPVPPLMEKGLFRTTPHLVAQPLTEKDVAETLRFAAENELPVYPRGVGSSPWGGSVPTRNGLVIDLSRMNRIIRLDPVRQTVVVQAGVRWADLAEHLEVMGRVPVTTPSSRFSTVGGWAATGGLGLHGYKYGHLREAIAAARVALPGGEVISREQDDEDLADFVGTEGQLGVFTELTLRVRAAAAYTETFLLTFPSVQHAFRFIRELPEQGCAPSHVAFYDRGRLAEENRLFRDRTGHTGPVVPLKEALLLHCDDREAAQLVETLAAEDDSARIESGPGGPFLWAERYFPLKGQRLGPNLLASEFLLDPQSVPAFVRRGRRLARRFGIELSVEAAVSRVDGRPWATVIASYVADRRRRLDYLLRLLLVVLLQRLGTQLGGKPYGVGIWNAPLVLDHLGESRLAHLRARKDRLDPTNALNPHKFFGLESRFRNVPGALFRPRLFHALLSGAAWLTLPLGWVGRRVGAVPEKRWDVPNAEGMGGSALLSQTGQRCACCGACISVCPAYALTGDELVTGRAKLQLSDALFRDEPVLAAEAFSPFQCLRCGLCEEVCQTRLPLRACYDELESLVTRRYGSGWDPVVRAFIATVDARRDWVVRIFGLDLANWSPPDMAPVLPGTRPPIPEE